MLFPKLISRRNLRRVGVERKILTTILWVGITPLTIVLIVGYAVVHESQRGAIQNTLAMAAQKTADGIELALTPRLRSARMFARDPEVEAALRAGDGWSPERREALEARLKLEAESAGGDEPSVYGLFDSSGVLVFSTSELPENERVHENWPEEIQEPVIGHLREDTELRSYSIRIVAPVHSPGTEQLLGFFAEYQGSESLLRFAYSHDLRSPSSGNLDVYQVVYASEKLKLAADLDSSKSPAIMYATLDPKLEAALNNPATANKGSMRVRRYMTQNGTSDVLLAYHRIRVGGKDSSLCIVVHRSASAVFSSVNLWTAFSFLGSALVIALFCVMAYRNVHNNIVRPVSLLNEGAQIIRQGDLDLKLKIGTGDEIEELASSFNKMALALKRNVSQLEESEEKYRSLITSMRDGVYQTDPEGRTTFLNPAGAEILGYEHVEDAASHSIREFFLEEIDYARISDELAKQSFIDRTRVWMERKDGRAICVELSGNQVLDDEGEVVGTEGIFRDVTVSVRLEQDARERTERIAAINQIANVINSSLEAGRLHESLVVEVKKMVDFDYASVALLDDEGETFRVRRLWPALEQGAEPQPPLEPKESCAAWVAENRRHLLIDDLRAEEQGDAAFCPAREFPKEIRACLCAPLHATGRIIGTLNLGSKTVGAFTKHAVEVLEQMAPHIAVALRNARLLENLQHSLEEVTRAREKLHEANAQLKTLDEMKTNLLSNVSHELRTPLVAVMGYTDMMCNRKVGPVNEVQAEYLGIILRNVEKLVTLIENLLDFSRLHRGTEKTVFDTFDIVDCARTSIQIVKPVADGRDMTIILDASEERILVEGDKSKLGQVFNNLLSNAVKFNDDAGHITVALKRGEDSVEIAITDTGIGIPAEALDKVFTRFYQYDSSSTRKYGGTGIGLSIAQDIVRLHGSRMTVTSEEGEGTTFRFLLPLRRTDDDRDAGSELPLALETQSVLELVTRDRALSLQLREVLRPENMEVILASDSACAISLARRYEPDCLLVDMEAAGNGHALLDDLLDAPTTASTPIVLLTNDRELYKSYRSFVAAYVKRSFRKSGLLSGIHLALSQSVAIGEPLGNKILCVDDDPEILVFIARCLDAEGYEVDTCSSGEQALERLTSRDYGLVLLDIAMPGLDGWEICHRIKSGLTLAGIQVYLVTAKPIDSSNPRLQEVGVDGYILKPFKPEELAELVRGIIDVPAREDI